MEAPITMGINHKPAPELLVPYWIDGLGSWWESALYTFAEKLLSAMRKGFGGHLEPRQGG